MPNRIIKESICYSSDIDQLSPFEETVFYRLIVNCDDYGRFDARPEFVRSKLFVTKRGITDKNVQDAVSKLASIGLVRLYEVDGKSYLLFPKWEKHQRIRNSKEKWPAPTCDNSPQVAADFSLNPIQSESKSKSKSEIYPTGISAHAKRIPRGEYGWVRLTDDEYARIVEDHGAGIADQYIAYVDESAQGNGNKNKWKDWNLVVRKAIREKWGRNYASGNSGAGKNVAAGTGGSSDRPNLDFSRPPPGIRVPEVQG